jgi:cubilin
MFPLQKFLLISIGVILILSSSIVSAQEELTDREGEFWSPNYPNPYPHGLTKIWIIRLPNPQHKVFLRFRDFSTESLSTDKVEVRNGPNATSPVIRTLGGSYVGHPIVLDFTATGHELHIKFTTDSSAAKPGFYAEYYSITGLEVLTEQFGSFMTTNYPANYPNNDFHQWVIRPSGDYSLAVVQFESLKTEECCDKVEIRDDNGIIGTYTGEPGPRIITTKNSALIVRFASDSSSTEKGFSAKYGLGIQYNLTRNTGEILSQNYPQNYSNVLIEQWVIEVKDPLMAKIHLFFKEFNTQSESDYLEIRNGADETSPLLGTHSGNSLPQQYLSTGKFLFLRFSTDLSYTSSGFSARYDAVRSDFELPTTTTTTTTEGTTSAETTQQQTTMEETTQEETHPPTLPEETTKTQEETTNASEETTRAQQETTTGQVETTPSSIICPIPEGSYSVRYPGDCQKYYICDEGIPIEMSCPDLLWFDFLGQRCDWIEFVKDCPWARV